VRSERPSSVRLAQKAWRTHRSATRGWRFEAVARGLWAVRTSLLPRPRCVTSARHPFGASACGVRLRGRVSSRSVDPCARSSWPFVPSTAPAPPRTRAETFLNDTRCVGTHPVHLRVYAPTCVYRDQYLKIRAPAGAAYTHIQVPTILDLACIRTHLCAYTPPGVREPAWCVYAPTAASIRICANAARGAYTRTRVCTRRCVYAGTRRTSCNNMRTGSGEAGVTHHISSSERPSHHISSSERHYHVLWQGSCGRRR